MRRVALRVAASAAAIVLAASPSAAFAADRALSTPDDTWVVVGVTVLGLLGVLVLAAVGYLYRRERHLDWEFQRPDEPHEDAH